MMRHAKAAPSYKGTNQIQCLGQTRGLLNEIGAWP